MKSNPLEDYEFWRNAVRNGEVMNGAMVVEHKHDHAGFRKWASQLATMFLSGSLEDRVRIISTVTDESVLWLLAGVPLVLTQKAGEPLTREVLDVALAMLAIVDSRVERRELDHSMRQIIAAGNRVGLPICEFLQSIQRLIVSPHTSEWITFWRGKCKSLSEE